MPRDPRRTAGGDSAPALETLQAIVSSIGERGDHLAVLALSRQGAARWSYRSLSDHARRLGAGLAASGVQRGEPIALFAPNRPEWIIAGLAILDACAVAVLVDAQVRGDDLAHYFRDSGSRRVFTVREHAERLAELRLDPRLTVVLLDADAGDERSWRRLLAAEPRELPRAKPSDRAALFYTAGTTGPPKGVPLTHENCASNLRALLEARVATPDDRILLPLPFHHVYPFMIGLMSVLVTGATLVLPAGLTGPQIVRALREGEVTTIVGVPRFYEALVSGLEARVRARGRLVSAGFRAALAASIGARRALGLRAGRALFRALHRELAPRVRIVASGGAKLDPAVGWKLEGLGWEVCTGYGLTETAPNHRSLLDPFVIAAVLPLARLRQTFWGGATEWLFTTPFARWLSRLANVVPVDPRRAAISSIALGAAVLQRHHNLVWFPEGGRSPTGELQRFLPGVGKLLERFKVPVVPVFIHGTERALPPGRFLPRRARVTVVFGDPIHPDELARRGEGTEPAERITNALRDAVAELGRRGSSAETRRRAA